MSVDDLFAAIERGDLERVRALIAAAPGLAASSNAAGLSAVLSALYRGRRDIASVLLAADPDLDVFTASAVGDAARMTALLESQPELARAYAADGFTALHLAAFFGQTETAAVLLAHGADVNAVARNAMVVQPLHSAVAGAHREVSALLVQHGADVNARQQAGWTPLHEAAQHGDRALIDMLLAAGANPSATMEDGQLPADVAAAAGHAATAALLRERQTA